MMHGGNLKLFNVSLLLLLMLCVCVCVCHTDYKTYVHIEDILWNDIMFCKFFLSETPGESYVMKMLI